MQGLWYVQNGGLAMRVSLALLLTNLWLKEDEPALMKEISKMTLLNEDSWNSPRY